MENGNNDKKLEAIYSKRLRAGKRRTYFFDVRSTKGSDYYLTITESRKRFDDNGYDRHKVFLYKEDFNKFLKALNEAVDYVKTELMPDFDFDAFNHDEYDEENSNNSFHTPAASANPPAAPAPIIEPEAENTKQDEQSKPSETSNDATTHEEVDKW